MARWQTGEWNVHFTLTVENDGYVWHEIPHTSYRQFDGIDAPQRLDSVMLVLGPSWWNPRDWNQRGPNTTKWGRKIARNALNAFRSMAVDIDAIDRRYQQEAGISPWSQIRSFIWFDHDGDPQSPYQRSRVERQDRIRAFADQFGTLGDGYNEFHHWVREAGEFVDALQVSQMIRQQRACEIEQLLTYHEDHSVGIYYHGNWVSLGQVEGPVVLEFEEGPGMFPHRRARTVRKPSGLPDPYQEFLRKSATEKAWHVFNMIIAQKLEGALSLAPGGPWGTQAGIVNANLRSLLYLRLWLDTKEAKDVARRCRVCGVEIEGNRNRQFCSNAHRQKHYRDMAIRRAV
jgi:hypothetical protein